MSPDGVGAFGSGPAGSGSSEDSAAARVGRGAFCPPDAHGDT
jgi:hypothetical protein